MDTDSCTIRIVAVKGSVRPGNFTSKALALVVDELEKRPEVDVHVVDPAGVSLGFPGAGSGSADAKQIRDLMASATGIVLSTPEYHGSYSSVIKVVIENLGFPSRLAGKPVALLGVAAGQIGAVKALEHLRSVCSHVGSIVLPGSVSVPSVQDLFDEVDRCLDENTEDRIRGLGANLLDFIRQHSYPRAALETMVREEAQE